MIYATHLFTLNVNKCFLVHFLVKRKLLIYLFRSILQAEMQSYKFEINVTVFAVPDKKPMKLHPIHFLVSYALANSSDFITSAHANTF